jgi:hypothetical protein
MKNEVDKHVQWFVSRMKPTSTRLTKMMIASHIGEKAPSEEELNKEKDEFFSKILPALDQ